MAVPQDVESLILTRFPAFLSGSNHPMNVYHSLVAVPRCYFTFLSNDNGNLLDLRLTSLSKKYSGTEFKHNKHLGFYHLPDAGLFGILITSLLSLENRNDGSAAAL